MEYNIRPPSDWLLNDNKFLEQNLFSKILLNYEDSDIVFKVIKKSGELKSLTKSECINLSKKFAIEIKNLINNKSDKNQIKIMGIIGASEESLILMLSSLVLGAHHCICFEDLSSDAISQRLNIFKPDIIICKSQIHEKIKSSINNNAKVNIPLLIIDLHKIKNSFDFKDYKARSYNKNSKLFTLFTSGSTGKPKAIIHGAQGYLDYAKYTTQYFFGISKNSKIFTAVDAGWINGHTYAFYGPLLLGGISIINEMPTLISIPRILGEYLNKIKPDCFYTSVTLLRLLKSLSKSDEKLLDYTDKDFKLERIGSCGEPLADKVGQWAMNFFNPYRKSIVNTYFQTETGGILVAPRDEDLEPKYYSSVGKPNPNLGLSLAKDIMSIEKLAKEKIEPNELLIKNYWQGIFSNVISDKESNYFTKDGYYRLHDVGFFDDDGYLYIGGRSDDVINVSGHRISTSEIESICLGIDSIKEACAVSAPDKLTGEKIVLFFTPSQNKMETKKVIKNLKETILKKLTKYHLPYKLIPFYELPKTQSGKIMRRIMRELAENSSFDEKRDYSTLANKEAFLNSKDIYLNSILNNL